MKSVLPVILTTLILRTGSMPVSAVQTTPRSLLAAAVEMLNSKNRPTVKTFINRWFVLNSPIEERIDRWMALSEQGAPFKIESDGPQTDSEVDAVVSDKNGVRLAFKMHLQSGPALKIVGLQLAPAYTIEGANPGAANWKDLKDLSLSIMAKSHSPAMGIAMINGGKLEISVSGFRRADSKIAVQPDDVWSIGSIGKPICSTVIGKLIEEGKLRWNETLGEAFRGIKMAPGYAKVTLEQVMHHRGGIPPDLGFKDFQIKAIVGVTETPQQIRDRYVRDILSRNPVAKPDQKFVYSNAGYALLSHIAETAAGVPYEALVKKHVFIPLGLTHSFTAADKLPAARPSGHVQGAGGLESQDMTGPMESMFAGAGGGMYMSVADLAKFGQAHLDGLNGKNGLLKASTIQRLHQGVREQTGSSREYACGWSIESVPGLQPFQGHNGSNGTMRAELAIFPSANLVIVGVVNRGGEDEPAPGMQAVLAIGQRYASRK